MRPAAYARFSTELQSAASLEDQLRNVRTFCDRQGWPCPVVYTDAAMSGSREDRPSYRALLRDAGDGRFDVVLVDDLSRLSRDKDECGKIIKRLTFAGVRVIGVSDGVDTAAKGHKVNAGLRGLMSELYLDDLAEKTHRGLTGRALAGASAGGLPFGYRVAGTGQRSIDVDQAAVVRRIFADYIAGRSPRTIAADLNRERVPSTRGGSWGLSAIYGDVRRGIGILANPIYVGRQIWNRSKFVKHPDSGRRLRKERPESEWIVRDRPELAIVDVDTWNAAQARIRRWGDKFASPRRGGRGRETRYLLSGILRCSSCGGPMVVLNARAYGCSASRDRGEAVCPNRMLVARDRIEPALLAGIKHELLSDAAWKRAERAVAAALAEAAPNDTQGRARLAAAKRVHANIVYALRAGIITATTRAELLSAEAELEASKAAVAAEHHHRPAQLLPRARDHWRHLVEQLEHAQDIPERRSAMQALVGESITLKEEAGELFAEIGGTGKYMEMVAGARFGLYLPEPIRIPIPRQPSRR
jgi:DNA invertase Pin-like site-specific DNA recombinase